jgi:hypothetical protein
MKLKWIRWAPVLVCGWLFILISAAILLPPTNAKMISAMAIPILALMLFWRLLSVLGLFFIFIEHGDVLGSSQTEHIHRMDEHRDNVCARRTGRYRLILSHRFVSGG